MCNKTAAPKIEIPASAYPTFDELHKVTFERFVEDSLEGGKITTKGFKNSENKLITSKEEIEEQVPLLVDIKEAKEEYKETKAEEGVEKAEEGLKKTLSQNLGDVVVELIDNVADACKTAVVKVVDVVHNWIIGWVRTIF